MQLSESRMCLPEVGTRSADLRFQNFIQKDQFPYRSALGWEYDSGDYAPALRKAMDMVGYEELRKEQAESVRVS